MNRFQIIIGLAVFGSAMATLGWQAGSAVADPGIERLRSVEAFAAIDDEAERAAALFVEAGKVLLHPRCVNCHPSGDAPLQGEDGRAHEPPVVRGTGGMGAVGMRCTTCHLKENFDPGRVPGEAHWRLAPIEAAWEGVSLAAICDQLKDPERNGGRDLGEIVEHMAEDSLVGWAWAPGAGRRPPPGSQKIFGELIAAWVDAGAACPPAAD